MVQLYSTQSIINEQIPTQADITKAYAHDTEYLLVSIVDLNFDSVLPVNYFELY